MGGDKIRFLVIAFLSGLLLVIPVNKAMAQSSLSACGTSAANAAACAELFGTRSAAANNVVPFARTATVEAVNAAGQVVASQAVPIAGTVAGSAITLNTVGTVVAGGSASFGIGALSAAGLAQLQNDAFTTHCTNAAACTATPDFTGGQTPGVSYRVFVAMSYDGSDGDFFDSAVVLGAVEGVFLEHPTPTQTRVVLYSGSGRTGFGGGGAEGWQARITDIQRVDGQPDTSGDPPGVPATDFNGLSAAQRAAALDRLSSNDLRNGVGLTPGTMAIPADATGLRLAGGAGTMAGVSGSLAPGANAIPVAPVGTDPNASPSPGSQPGIDPSGATNPDGSLSTAPGGAAEPIPATVIVADNFLTHAQTAFANKFPMDVIGTASIGAGSNECPSFTFFLRTYELCFITTAISAMRIPVLLGFLIWSLMSI